tara:strand:+ start:60111 stop:60281 length:171 start_codon:yes stop_codon:yes gene_type:complete
MSNDHRDQRGGHQSRHHCCDYCSKGRLVERSASRTTRKARAERAEQRAEIDKTPRR